MSFHCKTEQEFVHVGIVGLGARGLSVLERIAAHYRAHSAAPATRVHVVDPREHGAGTHITRQPDHLLINTVASQVTMFADETVEMEGPIDSGPTLVDWARSSGYRRVGDAFVQTPGDEGEQIGDNDYVPRRLLGDYLSWVSDRIVCNLPDNLTVEFHRAEVTDISDETSGQYRILLSHGFAIRVNYVFLCLGHGVNMNSENDYRLQSFVASNKSRNADLGFYRSCYPLTQLEGIAPKATVAVQGVGLSAHDVIAELTVGRRGKFFREGNLMRYAASGREPKIMLFSRRGLPFEARGINQKGSSGQYKSEFFTVDFVKNQKKNYGSLDFERHLLPCLVKEMKIAALSAIRFAGISNNAAEAALCGRIDGIFDNRKMPVHDSLADFRQFVIGYLEEDLREAARGNVDDPYKAATDVLRDARDTIRFAIDWGGLKPDSHRAFLLAIAPIMNRVAVGPPRVRNEQLLALMREGIVSMAGGPGARILTDVESARFDIVTSFAGENSSVPADVVVAAMIDPFYPMIDSSQLVRNLLRNGSIIPYFNGSFHPGGIAINHDYRPLRADQRPHHGMWALGSLVEGPNFYTFVLPRPGVNSRFIRDADACVAAMVKDVELQPIARTRPAIDRLCTAN